MPSFAPPLTNGLKIWSGTAHETVSYDRNYARGLVIQDLLTALDLSVAQFAWLAGIVFVAGVVRSFSGVALSALAPAAPKSVLSTGCFPELARPTTLRAAARPSWSRWWRRRQSSTRQVERRRAEKGGKAARRPASARWSSSTKSATARPPSTGCPSPGRRSSTCTKSIAVAACSPPTSTN